MKKTILLCASVVAVAAALAQSPRISGQKEFGGNSLDGLRSLCLSRDGGLLAAGYSTSDSSGNKKTNTKGIYDMWLIKQDSLGTKQWERSLGGSGDEVAIDTKATPDGGYIVVGFSTSGVSGNKTSPGKGGYDFWIVKTDSLGRVIWDKSLGGSYDDLAESVDLTTDGGYIVAGMSRSKASGDMTEGVSGFSDIWMVKLDAGGNIVWQRTLGGSGADGYNYYSTDPAYGKNYRLAVCRQLPDGGYVMATYSSSGISGDKTAPLMGNSDYWVVKLDSGGNTVWDKTIGGSGSDYVGDLTLTQDGGLLVAGYSNSPASGSKTAGSKGGVDYWLVKMNSAGGIEWDKTIGGSSDDVPQSVLQQSDGSYVIGGYSNSVISGDKTSPRRGGNDYWLMKTDNAGTVLWDASVGGSGDDFGLDMKQVAPGSYLIGGESYSGISGNKTTVNYGTADFWGVRITAPGEAIAGSRLAGDMSFSKAALPAAQSFLAYPNPANSILYIQNAGKATFVLTDLSGKKILAKTFDGNSWLNVAQVPAGTYYLTSTTTGRTQTVLIKR